MVKKRIRRVKTIKHPVVVESKQNSKPSLVMIAAILVVVFIAYVGLMGLLSSLASFGSAGNTDTTLQSSSELYSSSPGFNFSFDATNIGLAILLFIALIAVVGIVITLLYNRPKRLHFRSSRTSRHVAHKRRR